MQYHEVLCGSEGQFWEYGGPSGQEKEREEERGGSRASRSFSRVVLLKEKQWLEWYV